MHKYQMLCNQTIAFVISVLTINFLFVLQEMFDDSQKTIFKLFTRACIQFINGQELFHYLNSEASLGSSVNFEHTNIKLELKSIKQYTSYSCATG